MRDRRPVDDVPGVAVDRACLSSVALFLGLTLASAPKVPGWRTAADLVVVAGVVYAADAVAAAFGRLALGKEASALAAGRWVRREGA